MRKNPRLTVIGAMRKQGLSQVALAARLGINQANLSRILRNLQDPSETTKAAFLRELGVPVTAWGNGLQRSTREAFARAEAAASSEAA